MYALRGQKCGKAEWKFAGNRPNFGIYIVTDTVLQMALIIMAIITATSSVRNFQAKLGLPLRNQIAGWVVLVVSTMLPFFHLPKHRMISSKVMTYFLGLGIILSISIERLFYLALGIGSRHCEEAPSGFDGCFEPCHSIIDVKLL